MQIDTKRFQLSTCNGLRPSVDTVVFSRVAGSERLWSSAATCADKESRRAIGMSDAPLVSVVLVIRDVEEFLFEAIESILHQTFGNFEFIIVDFGSRDQSKEIAARYAATDGRIKVIEIAPCSYIEAKISACAFATGRYIAIQDADDISFPERLQLEVEFLEQHPEVGLLGGAVQWIDRQGNVLKFDGAYPSEDLEIKADLKVRNPFWHPTVLMRREAYVRVGGYRAAFTQSDDYDLWLRISEHYQCANLKQRVLKYRVHSGQLSVQKRKDQVFCFMAARTSASLRREGKVDPLDSAVRVTPSLLTAMGVSETAQRKEFESSYDDYIKGMFYSGSYATVPDAVDQFLRDCKRISLDSRFVVNLLVLAARACWKEGKRMRGILAAARAVRARPRILAHPGNFLVELQREDGYQPDWWP
jgi:glycosyltransferase involved in cell wall biosynthesis